MAAIDGKRSIWTILRKNRGLLTVRKIERDLTRRGTVESLSNDDDHGNENGVHHALFVHFFAVVVRLQR